MLTQRYPPMYCQVHAVGGGWERKVGKMAWRGRDSNPRRAWCPPDTARAAALRLRARASEEGRGGGRAGREGGGREGGKGRGEEEEGEVSPGPPAQVRGRGGGEAPAPLRRQHLQEPHELLPQRGGAPQRQAPAGARPPAPRRSRCPGGRRVRAVSDGRGGTAVAAFPKPARSS